MIIVTRLKGHCLALNPDLVQRAESTPDTVITLVDGTKYVVEESVEELVERIRDFRASVICAAHQLEVATEAQEDDTRRHVVRQSPEYPHLANVSRLPVRDV